jgi:putative oxidoreductase
MAHPSSAPVRERFDLANKNASVASLIGRVSVASIFLISGLGKMTSFDSTARFMSAEGLRFVPVLLVLAIVIEVSGALSLLLGYKTRVGALWLIAYLVPTTLVFHDFWTFLGPDRQMQMVHFMKNVAILGGLLVIHAFGPGPVSVDARSRRHPLISEPPAHPA